jgi:ribokinase
MAIVVFGSINMDLVVRTQRLPVAGETLTGHSFFTAPGGKGANQAVACARLGATTRLIGRVGDDVFGAALCDGLRAADVNIAGVIIDSGISSGTAVIAVNDAAENTIIVVPGANGQVGAEDLERLAAALVDARALLLQLEVPLPAVVAAAQQAHARGVLVILDPAPAQPLPDELYAAADIITPNETEAAALVGFPIQHVDAAERAAQALLARGVRSVIVKLGGRGAYWHDGTRGALVPPFKVDAIDTVAAGDAFNGGLATALDAGLPFEQAIRWAMAAGASSTTRAGAQPSLPSRAEVLGLLGESA